MVWRPTGLRLSTDILGRDNLWLCVSALACPCRDSPMTERFLSIHVKFLLSDGWSRSHAGAGQFQSWLVNITTPRVPGSPGNSVYMSFPTVKTIFLKANSPQSVAFTSQSHVLLIFLTFFKKCHLKKIQILGFNISRKQKCEKPSEQTSNQIISWLTQTENPQNCPNWTSNPRFDQINCWLKPEKSNIWRPPVRSTPNLYSQHLPWAH